MRYRQRSFATANLLCKRFITQETSQDNGSPTLSFRQPQKPEQEGSHSAFSGYQGTVTTRETTQQINWPRKRQFQARHTRFDPSYQERRPLFATISVASGSRSGRHPRKGVIFARSTVHYLGRIQDGCTVHYDGIGLTY